MCLCTCITTLRLHTQIVDSILVKMVEFDVLVAQYIWVWGPALLVFLQQVTESGKTQM